MRIHIENNRGVVIEKLDYTMSKELRNFNSHGTFEGFCCIFTLGRDIGRISDTFGYGLSIREVLNGSDSGIVIILQQVNVVDSKNIIELVNKLNEYFYSE